MESVQSANVDTTKFVALDVEAASATTTPKWKCCDFSLKMLEEGIHTDITFLAKDGSVRAHKSVLASVSSVFSAMFQRGMKVHFTSVVDISDMSIEAVQLFLLLLYTTDKVGIGDEAEGFELWMTYYVNAADNKRFGVIHKEQRPHFNAAIDKHFDELHKAVLKYQVEDRLGHVLITALARNLTTENCWYYYGSSVMAAPGPFKNMVYLVCLDYIIGNYNGVIASKCFLEEMRCNPSRIQKVIMVAEVRGARKRARENHIRVKEL